MKKKIFAIFLIAAALLNFSSCGSVKDEFIRIKNRNNLRIGILLMQGETEEHISALKSAAKDAGIKEKQIKPVENAAHKNVYNDLCTLADDGCNLIFAVGNGINDFVEQAAMDYPDIRFIHTDSSEAESSGAGNLHSAVFDETQARYAAGIAAGYKLRDLIKNELITEQETQVGFVASYPDSYAISAYTAFYLGIKSVCESAIMQVQYTYDFQNTESEIRAAKALISNGCVLVSQQSDSNSAAETCRKNGVYFVGNGLDADLASEIYTAGIKKDFRKLYASVIEQVIIGNDLPAFICEGYSDSDVCITQINGEAFIDTGFLHEAQTKVHEAENAFANGTLKVFDTAKWTVNGERIKTTLDEMFDEYYQGMEYINSGGYFSEYEFSAEPKFAFIIDGITQMNAQ